MADEELKDEIHKMQADAAVKDISKATIYAIEFLKEGSYDDFIIQVQMIGADLNIAYGHCKFIRNDQEKMNCRDKASSAYDDGVLEVENALKKKCE